MEYTKQLQLNQWALDDQILMEDFNSDNQKLETAYQGLQQSLTDHQQQITAVPVVKLAEQSVAEATGEVTLNLSGVNMSQFRYLRLLLSGTYASSNGEGSDTLCLTINHDSGQNYCTRGGKGIRANIGQLGAVGGAIDTQLFDGGSTVMIKGEGYAGENTEDFMDYGYTKTMYLGCGLSGITSMTIASYPSQEKVSGLKVVLYGWK